MLDLGESYLWVKAFHVVAIIAWMAGLLYLPRLFVYHTEVGEGSEASQLFKVMERRLLKAIMWPAAVASWVLGLLLMFGTGAYLQGWMHAKLLLAILLTVAHVAMQGWKAQFARDANRRPQKFYRVMNEVPTLLMIGIVILVIVRPF